MPNSGLTGSRIRQTRISRGLRQVELAANVKISPSYLNLIEHNRRRIGGKLLVDIARELDVETDLLIEGTRATLLSVLEEAALDISEIKAETDRTEEFAGRFPGWADLIQAQHNKNLSLLQTVEALLDRLTHDPQLAASMHEMLSVVTAIRSTAAIMASGEEIEPEWQTRFQRNLYEDSQRLAKSAQSLVAYLDETDEGKTAATPTLLKEDFENWLAKRGYYLPELEGAKALSVAKFLAKEGQLTTSDNLQLYAQKFLARYRSDAKSLPRKGLLSVINSRGVKPLEIAQKFGLDLGVVFRRIASLDEEMDAPCGLVSCDSSGTLTFVKPIEGFAIPKFGAACPYWPLFQSLSRPLTPLAICVLQSGHRGKCFQTFAVAQPASEPSFGQAPLFEATMIILPAEKNPDAIPVGSSCRICARDACQGRREPSIYTSGF